MCSHPSLHFLTVRRGPGSFLVKEIKFPLVGLLIEQDTTILSEQPFHFGWLGCPCLPCFPAGGQQWFSSGFWKCCFTFSPLHTAFTHICISLCMTWIKKWTPPWYPAQSIQILQTILRGRKPCPWQMGSRKCFLLPVVKTLLFVTPVYWPV